MFNSCRNLGASWKGKCIFIFKKRTKGCGQECDVGIVLHTCMHMYNYGRN